MDSKLEKEQQEHPPIKILFECQKCKIEFTRTIIYHENPEEYEKFADTMDKMKSLGNEGEDLESVVFLDICHECRNKK